MTTQQGLRQQSVRDVTGTTGTYEGDWHALWDSAGIAAGPFGQRMLAWINARLSAAYTELNGAMAAFAAAEGVGMFSAIGTFSPGGGTPAEGTIDLAWDGNAENLIPIFDTFDIPDPQVGDVIRMRRSTTVGFASYDQAEDTITSLTPVNVLDFDFGGNWDLDTFYVQVLQYRSAVLIDTSNIETVTITGDITAPVLSNPVDTAVGSTTGSGSVDTNEADGTLYWVVSSSATAPSAAQVKAGQTHTGAAATDSGSQAVTATGTQSISGGFTMTSGATFYAHYMHEDSDGNQSNIATGDGFGSAAAPTLSSPVDTKATSTTGTGSVSTNDDSGTLYWVVSTSATPPSKAQVKAGQMHTGSAAADSGSQAVSATGVQTITGGFTGLTQDTAYYAHYMHENAGALQSDVSSGDGFTTEYNSPGAVFDGTNDWMARGADLTGAGSSKLLTFSCWYKSASDSASFRAMVVPASTVGGTGGLNGSLLKTDTHAFRIQWFNSSNTIILQLASSTNALQIADGWVHILCSVDLSDTAKRHIYIDDVSDLATVTTYTDQNMEFASNVADWGIGGTPGGTSRMFGDLADLYFAPGQYIDFSVEANRRKFITSTGYPVNLGSDGSTPTGVAPLIYVRGGASGFPTNIGSGGGFTLTGTLTDSATEVKL